MMWHLPGLGHCCCWLQATSCIHVQHQTSTAKCIFVSMSWSACMVHLSPAWQDKYMNTSQTAGTYDFRLAPVVRTSLVPTSCENVKVVAVVSTDSRSGGIVRRELCRSIRPLQSCLEPSNVHASYIWPHGVDMRSLGKLAKPNCCQTRSSMNGSWSEAGRPGSYQAN